METKELIIDSTYRDRNKYENPCDFVVQVNRPMKYTLADADDPVSFAAPLNSWTGNTLNPNVANVTMIAGTIQSISAPYIEASFPNPIFTSKNYYAGLNVNFNIKITKYEFIGISGAGNVGRFYIDGNIGLFVLGGPLNVYHFIYPIPLLIGNKITFFVPGGVINSPKYLYNQTLQEYETILSSTSDTVTVQLSSGAWTISDKYSLRNGIPVAISTVNASTTYTITPAVIPTVPLQIVYIPDFGYYGRVTKSTGGVLTVSPALPPVIPVGTELQYLNFDYDNVQSLQYVGTRDQQERTWIVNLKSVMIPKRNLQLQQYSHIFLEFRDPTYSPPQNIMSNNPHINNISFRLTLDKAFVNSKFYTFYSEKSPKTIRFTPTSSYFIVRLLTPDGKILEFEDSDSKWPCEPIHDLQINISFILRMQ